MLVFPDYDVKNGAPLEFAFDESTTTFPIPVPGPLALCTATARSHSLGTCSAISLDSWRMGQAVLSFQFLMTTHAPPRALTWSQSLSASAKLSEPTLTA